MKTKEEYKEEFIKRASIGYLLKLFKIRWNHCKDESGDWSPNDCNIFFHNGASCKNCDVIARDAVWSKESGQDQFHTWSEIEFKEIMNSKGHFRHWYAEKIKRQKLASKYRHGRSSHKKKCKKECNK